MGFGSSFAQENTSNKANKKDFSMILPQARDFTLGIDLANFIRTINNSITNANADNSIIAFRNDIFGKYFITNNSAVRVRFGIGIDNFTDRSFVRDDIANLLNPLGSDPLLEIQTVDVHKNRNTTIELGIGYEYRRSLWRVQGYAGAELFGGVILSKDIYEYGNPMTATNQTPTSSYASTTNGYRPLESVKGNTMTLGGALFIGADFFICRNLSIGAEFNFEARYNRTGELSMRTQTWILEQAYTAEEKIKPVVSEFKLKPMGRLNLSVYF